MTFYRRNFFKQLATVLGVTLSPRSKSLAVHSYARPLEPRPAQSPVPRDDGIAGTYDLIVVGGGISGTSAAISAARSGVKVALVHERSMLGGNSSSEVKLYPENNAGYHPWIKEGGLNEEFHVEERVRNHQTYVEGTMNAHWDLTLYEWAIRESRLKLYLNTHMYRVLMKDAAHIRAVHCIQLGTEKEFELSAPLFVDATGDGVLGFRAGADFRWGREARKEYGESLAPAMADDKVMGNTLFFRAVNTGRPVPFKRPEWAATFERESDLTSRVHSFIDGGYWWIEVGAPYHPIKDNEEIRHEALRQLLGVWDHIKNRGDHKAEHYGLEFVGFWPYKRESRRILGDYVVTQQHVQDPQPLPDAVAYGTWGVDIHTQGGILAREVEPYPPPRSDKYFETYRSHVYGIPLRALYSRKIANLMMAGRPISCSYAAFASSRVLSTGSIVGQAVGVAASLCKKHKTTPRGVAKNHARECQQLILRQDGHIPGVINEDPSDLARQTTATASSEWRLKFPEGDIWRELRFPHAQLFPVSGDRVQRVELLLESKIDRAVDMRIGLREAAHVWDFRSMHDIAEARGVVPPRHRGWLAFDLGTQVEPGKLYYIYLGAQLGVGWFAFREVDGSPNRCPVGTTGADMPGDRTWRPITGGYSLAVRLTPESRPYGPGNVIRGTNRPDQWTNIWISDPAASLPQSLELEWRERQQFNTIQITFDTDQNRRITLPLFRYPDCVKDYRIECRVGGTWKTLVEVADNYGRRRVHRFDTVQADRARLIVLATNGGPSARVYELRVYRE
jgi:hypothetical protein